LAAGDTAVLLIAYGGPTRPEEIRPFLDRVLEGRPVPKQRYEEVVRHYEVVGGSSPINRLTFEQAARLRQQLEHEGPTLPVYVGMRHWTPLIAETLSEMAREGRRRAHAVILAPHPSRASWESYLEEVARARESLGPSAPGVTFADPFFEHPLFVEALVARVRECLAGIDRGARRQATLVYTAHSIPVAMSEASGYADKVARTAELVSHSLGIGTWRLAYQSRSGKPGDSWLEPDLADELRERGQQGDRVVVVAPIGFLCDHVEVLYDLDIEARGLAGELGIQFHRAATVGDHPAFIGMLADLVRDLHARAQA
jgi:ferrochelatase